MLPATLDFMKMPLLIAAAALAAIAVAVFYLNPRKTAEASISKIDFYAPQTTTKQQQQGSRVIGQAQETDSDLYVIVTLQVTNKLRLPIFINAIYCDYTASDDTVDREQASSATDQQRLEEIFPALAPRMVTPLSFDAAIQPTSSTGGEVLIHFPGFTEAMWKSRKSATLTFELAHQQPFTITLPK